MEDTEIMKWYACGHDFGNSNTDTVLIRAGQQLAMSVPTAFIKADVDAINQLGVKPEEATNLHIIQFADSIPFAYGDLALGQKTQVWSGRGYDRRYASHYNAMAILNNSARMIPDKEYGLYVVTGIPAQLFIRNPKLREEIKAELEGEYSFTTDGGATWRIAHIEVAVVVMEGAGALIAQKAMRNNDKATESAVIDIGGGTTDLYAQRGIAPVTEYCKSEHIAVEAVGEILRQQIKSKYRRELSDVEVREILYAYVSPLRHKPYPRLASYGEFIPPEELERVTSQGVKQVASEIMTFVGASWKDAASKFKPVLLIGRGSLYFKNEISKNIPHIIVPDDPGSANARGYAELAASMLNAKNRAAKAAQ
jgi:plasmid segregation protein ParM